MSDRPFCNLIAEATRLSGSRPPIQGGTAMPDERWLWDQPKTWHAMNRALHDIGVLLDYLNELPDSRLLSYFKATQDRILDPGPRNTVPPCDSYAGFLNRLDEIAAAFQTGRPPPGEESGRSGSPTVGAAAFVDWSRDFLAAVAAPATASSIRLTRQYAIYRSRSRFAWLGKPIDWICNSVGCRLNTTSVLPPLPHDPDQLMHERFARRLAKWVQRFEWATMTMVVFTLFVSIYALSGRLILANEKETAEAWAKLDALVEAQEDKTFPPPAFPISDKVDFRVSPLCELASDKAASVQFAAAAPTALSDGSEKIELPQKYLSVRQAHLCNQRAKLLQNLFVVTMHLQFWNSVIAGPRGAIGSPGSWKISLSPAALFGVAGDALDRFAEDQNGKLCSDIAEPQEKKRWNAAACKAKLWTLIDRSRNVAESVLGSITEYVLPVCYGLLGAMAAALRLIRRKVDAATLVPTDRARLQQGAILGVLCGAVIGLFANQVGGAENAGGLGLSALALIAGYNVDGVFLFLDELSDRIFGAAAQAR
jgi:hypothetical protein